MSFLNQLDSSSGYNYYPNTAISFCVESYKSISDIEQYFSSNVDYDLVWGPYELVSDLDVAYSLMFVAKRISTGECFVVIRGTNPYSLEAWLGQDFSVANTQPFADLPGNPQGVPSTALVSQGTFNGMSDLISLGPNDGGVNIVQFLTNENPPQIYVTGHSLGGTLTSPMFAYLNAMLFGGELNYKMAMWSFAGLTPGGSGFNDYLNSMVPVMPGYLWRIQNSLDIAPHMWLSFDQVKDIYVPNNLPISIFDPAYELLSYLFKESQEAGIVYSQPETGLVIPGNFETGIIDSHSWPAQAMHQHHATTYQPLVNAYYSS